MSEQLEPEAQKKKPDQRLIAYLEGNFGDCYSALKQIDKAKLAYASCEKLFSENRPKTEREFLMQLNCYRVLTDFAISDNKLQVARTLNEKAQMVRAEKDFPLEKAISLMQEVARQKERLQAHPK